MSAENLTGLKTITEDASGKLLIFEGILFFLGFFKKNIDICFAWSINNLFLLFIFMANSPDRLRGLNVFIDTNFVFPGLVNSVRLAQSLVKGVLNEEQGRLKTPSAIYKWAASFKGRVQRIENINEGRELFYISHGLSLEECEWTLQDYFDANFITPKVLKILINEELSKSTNN